MTSCVFFDQFESKLFFRDVYVVWKRFEICKFLINAIINTFEVNWYFKNKIS